MRTLPVLAGRVRADRAGRLRDTVRRASDQHHRPEGPALTKKARVRLTHAAKPLVSGLRINREQGIRDPLRELYIGSYLGGRLEVTALKVCVVKPKVTPHIRCDELNSFVEVPKKSSIYIKDEAQQHGRSIKGRVAYSMVRRSLESGKQIVESSSGNLALGLGHWSARLGAPAPLCLVDDCCEPTMREELLRAGCEIEAVALAPHEIESQSGVFKRVARAREYQARGYYWPNQYDNGEWVKIHQMTTGKEIWQDPLQFDLVVGAVGTGATVSGIALARPTHSRALVVAVEPRGSVIFGGQPGPYHVAGAGNPFTPRNYRKRAIDLEVVVDDLETFEVARRLRQAGHAIGSSGSMVLVGAAHALSLLSHEPQSILLVIADDGWYEVL